MAVDGFLKLPDIVGESQRDGHEDEIEIHSLRFGIAAADPERTAVSRRGRVGFDPVTLLKRYDRASPYLKQMLVESRRASEATIALRRTVEGDTRDYLVVVLTDASLVSYDLDTTEDGRLEETLTLGYRTIRFTYEGDHEVELEVSAGR
ncbi:Hcp family type VI secretion system effector [Ornithinimicrobium cavernae]|uniref:Hcp family type VI secretion system effector n=1 Tax=Ornithinimicrobium cavernae TaxID=2666047 RepID=UPI000D69CDCD|nr:type VI secretion system tube protein Hcp [Ornithinimicrobium cavernae]